MNTLPEFLHDLLWQGEAHFHERPPVQVSPKEQGEAAALLEQAFAVHRLEVAGPVIAFDRDTAVKAGELVRQAAWLLVDRSVPETELGKALQALPPPVSPAQHLSGDLVLRFLPAILRRAKVRGPEDVLTIFLTDILRTWPLTGVLSDVEEAPRTGLDFSSHSGLLLLYAERLARNAKRNWMPPPEAFEFVELVWKEEQRDPALLELLRQGTARTKTDQEA